MPRQLKFGPWMLATSPPVWGLIVPSMVTVRPIPPADVGSSVAVIRKVPFCVSTLPEACAADCMLFQEIMPLRTPSAPQHEVPVQSGTSSLCSGMKGIDPRRRELLLSRLLWCRLLRSTAT